MVQSEKLNFVLMAPHDLGLVGVTLMIFLFTFNTNLKKDTILTEYMHSLRRLNKTIP